MSNGTEVEFVSEEVDEATEVVTTIAQMLGDGGFPKELNFEVPDMDDGRGARVVTATVTGDEVSSDVAQILDLPDTVTLHMSSDSGLTYDRFISNNGEQENGVTGWIEIYTINDGLKEYYGFEATEEAEASAAEDE